ncbi:hypothetical protein AA18889_0182 [Acetobacter senegalensis DSM 18889]|nr:hypothetical protein AA18889_0182 [Acetobacter senegalensis DSM 18889]
MSSLEEKVLATFGVFRNDMNEIIESHNLLFKETDKHIIFACENFAKIGRVLSDIQKDMCSVSYNARTARSDAYDIQKGLTDISEEIKDIKDQLRFYETLMKELKRHVNDTQRANSDAIVGIWNRLDKLEGKTG